MSTLLQHPEPERRPGLVLCELAQLAQVMEDHAAAVAAQVRQRGLRVLLAGRVGSGPACPSAGQLCTVLANTVAKASGSLFLAMPSRATQANPPPAAGAIASFWRDPRLDAALRRTDELVGRLAGALPRGTALALFSGQGNAPLARALHGVSQAAFRRRWDARDAAAGLPDQQQRRGVVPQGPRLVSPEARELRSSAGTGALILGTIGGPGPL